MSNWTRKLLSVGGVALVSTVCAASPVSGQGTWETTLHARDINGDGIADAYYDSAQNITWLANWNVNGGDLPNAAGFMFWHEANIWATTLDVYGVTGWRLPRAVDLDSPGCNHSLAGGTDCGYNVALHASELAHMYYATLGNLGICTPGDAVCSPFQSGWGLKNTANFLWTNTDWYWTDTFYDGQVGNAYWRFNMQGGHQSWATSLNVSKAVAVRDGDVFRAVPEPSTIGLVLLGLGAGLSVTLRPVRRWLRRS